MFYKIELKDTMAHVGAALKSHILTSVKNTWNMFSQLAMFSKTTSNCSIEYDPKHVSKLLFNVF